MGKAQTVSTALRLLPLIEPFTSGDKLPDFGLPLLLPPFLVRQGLVDGKGNDLLIHRPRPPAIPLRRFRRGQKLHRA